MDMVDRMAEVEAGKLGKLSKEQDTSRSDKGRRKARETEGTHTEQVGSLGMVPAQAEVDEQDVEP